jgi:predicted transcriptional regulator
VHEHRDRIYMRKDIILKLVEHGELNQSKLMSYCGLNNVKHKDIIGELVEKGLITRVEEAWGSKTIIKYRASEKGKELAREILEPYEALFPRSETLEQKEGDRS